MGVTLSIVCLLVLVWQFTVNRKYGFAPLIVAAFLFPNLPFKLGALGFSPCRLVILCGLVRALCDRKRPQRHFDRLDASILVWAAFCVGSSAFHQLTKEENPLVVRLSMVYEIGGAYLYGRAWIRSAEDLLRALTCVAMVLIPLGVIMIVESAMHRSLYAAIGALVPEPWVREGRLRVTGPFGGSICAGSAAGTAAALMFPLISSDSRKIKRIGLAGLISIVAIVFVSSSSGPIVSLVASVTAALAWRWRRHLPQLRLVVFASLILLHLVMEAPVWFLMARIDFVGGSSSWGRAELISQALAHVDEWWFAGTDYTRHWMPYGIEWSSSHTDMTNYFIKMGVVGGIGLMGSFIMVLTVAFCFAGKLMRESSRGPGGRYMVWCVGAAIFAHLVTFFSISYYDQSYVPLFLLIGALSGVRASVGSKRAAFKADRIKPAVDVVPARA